MRVAVLYQAQQPPAQNGIIKPMKPGGYSDSSADIAYTLKTSGITVITPVQYPEEKDDLAWTFPDTESGIDRAIKAGADCIWLNTVLYKGHPIEHYSGLRVVGQLPSAVDTYDDKWKTNNMLRQHGLAIPSAEIVTYESFNKKVPTIAPPLVAKPIRGRGSEGVSLIRSNSEYATTLKDMFARDRFGTAVYLEKYLPGEEITVTVMPSGLYIIDAQEAKKETPWCMPGILRFNHQNGIAPYNGRVAVIHNSRVLTEKEEGTSAVQNLYIQCQNAANLVDCRAPIRIDCRADEQGKFYLFDLNMKPNMTGPSRPHRQDQDSLSALAARQIGWGYSEFLINILQQNWLI